MSAVLSRARERLWDGWKEEYGDEHTHQLVDELIVSVRTLNLKHNEETCVLELARFMLELYANLPARNDGAKPIAHILRVALKLARKNKGGYAIKNYSIIAAALAHDAVEDHPEICARLGNRSGTNDHEDALQFLSDSFEPSVGKIVSYTTHKKDAAIKSPPEKIREYSEYTARVATHPEALLVKIADVLDNVNHPSPTKNQQAYSMEKYWHAIPKLQSGVLMHRERIVQIGGHALFARIIIDLMVARSKASVWKSLRETL